jgi:hypothetical protein
VNEQTRALAAATPMDSASEDAWDRLAALAFGDAASAGGCSEHAYDCTCLAEHGAAQAVEAVLAAGVRAPAGMDGAAHTKAEKIAASAAWSSVSEDQPPAPDPDRPIDPEAEPPFADPESVPDPDRPVYPEPEPEPTPPLSPGPEPDEERFREIGI